MADSSRKFNRNYRLTAADADGNNYVIEPPFTIEFDITRNTLAQANICQIRVYNLGAETRNALRRNATDWGPPYQPLKFEAGYGDNLAEVFSGNIRQAWSVREGTNYITQMETFDGGFAYINSKTDRAYPAGTPKTAVIASMVGDLDYIKPGSIGSYPGVLLRGNTYTGNTTSLLNEQAGGGFFIDGGRAHVLGDSEYIPDTSLIVINAQSGLLGTPVLEVGIIRLDMLFEPRLNVGRQVLLESLTEANFNGAYKIISVKHRGMISGAVSGNVVTSAGFFYTKILTPAGRFS